MKRFRSRGVSAGRFIPVTTVLFLAALVQACSPDEGGGEDSEANAKDAGAYGADASAAGGMGGAYAGAGGSGYGYTTGGAGGAGGEAYSNPGIVVETDAGIDHGDGASDETTDPDARKDAGPPDEDAGIDEPQCITDRETVLYLSADDSNSMASPVIVRKMIRAGQDIRPDIIRTYEFTNYYDFDYQAPNKGMLAVVPQLRDNSAEAAGEYVLQIGVQSHIEQIAQVKPLNLTFVVDTSGSMSGQPIGLEKAVMRAIAANLRADDNVSMTNWNTDSVTVLDSHRIGGPDDRTFLDAIAGINASGGTDLHSGLVKGYELAQKNFDANKLNRVVLISDGEANVGVTDENLIAEHADDSEGDAIYLIGVGCGVGYNDTLMDTVTDAGKGAYLFIDTEQEAEKQFSGQMFVSNISLAAMDVQVKVTLPPTFSLEEFHGEEYSTDPKEVDPQHLAANDAMIFHQSIASCAPELLTGGENLVAEAFFTEPVSRQRRSVKSQATFDELTAQEHPQLLKGDAIVAYAEMFKQLPTLASRSEMGEQCREVQTLVQQANGNNTDADLGEIDSLLDIYCARFE
jgi:Ca-activated chloride channel family protein